MPIEQPWEPMDRLMNINQACVYLGVSRRCLYNWMRDGKISWVLTPGNSRRFRMKDLLKAGTVGPREN